MIHPNRKQTICELMLKKHLRNVLSTWKAHGKDPAELLNKWRDEGISPFILDELQKEFLI